MAPFRPWWEKGLGEEGATTSVRSNIAKLIASHKTKPIEVSYRFGESPTQSYLNQLALDAIVDGTNQTARLRVRRRNSPLF
ncbi:hypothetical protein [Phormidesmis priestleyi]